MKKRLHNSLLVFSALSLIFFAVMLIFNSFTPYISDDYIYMYSFHGAPPLIKDSDFFEIFRSMYYHSFSMNGRVISHGFEQLFMFFPKGVFNIVNSAVYVAMLYIIYRIINFRKAASTVLYLAVAMAVWCFTPAFGQVYLWQIGSVNYLWGVFFAVIYISPFVFFFTHGKELLKKKRQKALFCFFAIIMGMYNEITSFTVILFAAILNIIVPIVKKEKGFSFLHIAELFAIVGYILLLSMPSEVGAKQSSRELSVLLSNFVEVTELLKAHMLPLMLLWAGLFTVGCIAKINRDRLILSGLFAFCAVTAAYMMIIASYVPERCLVTTAVFAILAVGALLPEYFAGKYFTLASVGTSILAIVFAFSFALGAADILDCRLQLGKREAEIAEQKKAGASDLTLELIEYNTKYSPWYQLIDLQTTVSDTWPNNIMARYYGVNSIIGVKAAPEEDSE